jgi:hypothetical protein
MATIKGTVFLVPQPNIKEYGKVVDKGELNQQLQAECRRIATAWKDVPIPVSKGAIDEPKLEKLLVEKLREYGKSRKIKGKLSLAPSAHAESQYYTNGVKFWCERTENCDLTTATEQQPWQVAVNVDGQTVPVDVTLVVQHPFIPNKA